MISNITVDSDFPGGNIVVDKVDGTRIFVHQNIRDTKTDWFYWYFRVQGAAGQEITIDFTGSDVIGARGPAASLDEGQTWRWLGLECVSGKSFTFQVPAKAKEVRFSVGMPYTQKNLDQYLAKHASSPYLVQEHLCVSRKGRPVVFLRAGCLRVDAPYHILITCRHHACEMMASYTLEGIIDALFAETASGRWLRENTSFLIVPFVDKDGVEDGDQGKNRDPHDHNEDYANQSIYPEVAAIRSLVMEWGREKLDMHIDLHCPWLKNFLNEFVYFVGEKNFWGEVNRFSDILAANRHGSVPYYRELNLPMGFGWNVPVETETKYSTEWSGEFPGIRIANCLEIPYANALGAEVNQISARLFGGDLGRAIALYLQSL